MLESHTDTDRLHWLRERWKHTHVSQISEKWIVFFHSSPITEPRETFREAIDEAIDRMDC